MPAETILLHPNIARSKKVQDRVRAELIPLMSRVRKDRTLLNERWLRYRKIWMAERDVQGYQGRNQTYLAVGRRVIENWVQKLKGDLFPSEDWFDIIPTREGSASRVQSIKALFNEYLIKYMKIRRQTTPYLRGLVTFGTGPIEIGWRLDERALPTLQNILDDDGNPTGGMEEKFQRILKYIGPTFRPVDLFLWYCWPNTSLELDEMSLVFEDMMIDVAQVERLGKTDIDDRELDLGRVFENVKDAIDKRGSVKEHIRDKDKFDFERRRLQTKGLTSRMDVHDDPNRPLDITKAHWKIDLDGTGQKWWQLVIAGDDVVLQARRNRWWFDEPNYLVGKFAEVINQFYGEGLPGVFDHLQYFTNDVLNQAGDGLVWSMNSIAAIDMFRVQDPTSIRMRPGAKWLIENPASSVQFKEPPKETAAIGFQAVQQLIALINDVSNVAPFGGAGLNTGGRSRGRALQTAAGMQIVLSEALVQIRDVVTNLEDTVYAKCLKWMHILSQQFLDRPMLLRLASTKGSEIIEARITRGELIGDFDFQWLGSTHVFNQQVRGQQMIQYGQMAAQIPPELLANQNVEINWAFLMRQIWSDGLGLRGVTQIVRDIQQTTTVDPTVENELFRQGQVNEVEISPSDDDLKHAQVHDHLLQEDINPVIMESVQLHMRAHMAAFLAKQLMQQTQEAGGLPGQAGGGNGDSKAPGTPGRLPATGGVDDLFRSLPRTGSQQVSQ